MSKNLSNACPKSVLEMLNIEHVFNNCPMPNKHTTSAQQVLNDCPYWECGEIQMGGVWRERVREAEGRSVRERWRERVRREERRVREERERERARE